MKNKQKITQLAKALNNNPYSEDGDNSELFGILKDGNEYMHELIDVCKRMYSLVFYSDFESKWVIHYSEGYEEQILDDLDYLNENIDNPVFKAMTNAFLFDKRHKLINAQNAITYFYELLSERNEQTEISLIIQAMCDIFCKCPKLDFDFAKFVSDLFVMIEKGEISAYIIYKRLIRCTKFDPRIMNSLWEKIDELENTFFYSEAIDCCNLIIENKNRDIRERAIRKKIEICENYIAKNRSLECSDSDARMICYYVDELCKACLQINSKEFKAKARQIYVETEDYRKQQYNCRQSLKFEIDGSPVKEVLDVIFAAGDYKKIILSFGRQFPYITKEKYIELRENEKSSFTDLGSRIITDDDGNTITSISVEDTENRIIYGMAKQYSLCALLFVPAFIRRFESSFPINEENLLFLIENNPIIPDGRKKSFTKGIFAGFHNDFITAMHILCPQTEYAFRHFLKSQRIGVYRLKEDGNGIEILSLSTLLESKETEEIFDPDFLLNLKLMFTSDSGFDMRDDISHGTLSDDKLTNSAEAYAVWWFILHILTLFSDKMDI